MMFAVMKHWDIMIGVDQHDCWPPGAPEPIGPKPYFVCMLMMGTTLTAMMAYTQVTIGGWTMQRGTDIGPLIPHIGPPSLLTPLDVLFSSSASYFGPTSYVVEGMPAAAALMMVVNPNLNCNESCPLPTGLVLCFTTHFCGMTLFDILFGFISMGLAMAMEVATSAAANVAGKAVKAVAIKPISKWVTAKMASRKAAKVASAQAAESAGGAAAKQTGGAASGASAGKWTAAKPTKPATPTATPGTWQSAKPSKPAGPPIAGHRPKPDGPKIGGHRPGKPNKLSKKKFLGDLGLDMGAELALDAPFSMVNEAALELLAMSGIEEFGAAHEEDA